MRPCVGLDLVKMIVNPMPRIISSKPKYQINRIPGMTDDLAQQTRCYLPVLQPKPHFFSTLKNGLEDIV